MPRPRLVTADLRARWARDGGTGSGSVAVFDELLARHGEPHRRYHTARHLSAVLGRLDDLMADAGTHLERADDPTAIRLAAWFHDAIYDPRSSTNEEASAELARQRLGTLGQPPARLDAVARLVLSTAHHRPASADEAILLDADLAILGSAPSAYATYATAVRAEYAFVDDDTWRVGRAAVLRSFLGRDTIFHTGLGSRHEPRARANLSAELATLGAAG